MSDNTSAPSPSDNLQNSSAPLFAGLTVGFATAASMWTLGYLLHFPGLSTPPVITGIVLLLVLAVGAMLAGSLGPARSGLKVGLSSGLTAGLLNLLIVGSLLFDTQEGESGDRPSPVVIVLGWLAFSVILGAGGAWLGAKIRPASPQRPQDRTAWLARFGILSALAMLPLLLVGSVVTTSDSGMAVPDWPNTFGTNMFLFPLSRMTGGVYFEHTHRLFGALVGLTAMALMALTLLSDHSAKAKRLAVIIFVFIVAQGILGGTRVTESSRALALLHGVFAQGIFAMLVILAAMLSPRWNDGHEALKAPSVKRLTRLAWATFIVVLIQIALGGLIRHFSGETLSMHSAMMHAGWSFVVVGHVFVVCSRIASIKDAPSPLRRIGHILLALLGLQMMLGIVALGIAMMFQNRAEAPAMRLVMGATHQTVGALLLGGVALALAWIRRSLTDDGSASNKKVKKAAPEYPDAA